MECEEGKPAVRSPELRRFTGGARPKLCRELCSDTFVLDERAIASIRRSVFGFAGDGVDDLGTDTSDEPAVTADAERLWADVGPERGAGLGDPSGKVVRLLTDPLRASRPLTAAPSLIQP